MQRHFFFIAKRFVAGETIDSAAEAVRRLNAHGRLATIDVLGEEVTRPADVRRTSTAYLDLLDTIESAQLRANISLKLSALGLGLDEERCYASLREIVARAQRNADSFVRIDMEGSALTQRTLDLFARLFREHRNVGPVIQAYLRRSAADIAHLVELGARVRLCKGAYREPAEVALHDPGAIRRAFLRLAETLLLHGTYPAIATHDPQLIEAVRAFAALHGIGADRFEFQMLYGVRPDVQQRLVEAGYRVRIYVPFGTQWARYFSRRVMERRENAVFALRALLGARTGSIPSKND
ncbi:MAG TPA: proline dehydrogenase family protein [Candidatus Acidoferrales bacterium]|nr:proline dehydrogenase family protein [Candidatus Acidoferrales bacterium]